MTITAGIDTFATVEEADAYMANRLYAEDWPQLVADPRTPEEIDGGTAWEEPAAENAAKLKRKEQALRMASQILSQQRYKGVRTVKGQPLSWPRARVFDDDWQTYSAYEIPTAIKNASAELALILLREDLTDESTRRGTYLAKTQMVGQTFATYSLHAGPELPAVVVGLIAPFLDSQSSLRVQP